MALMIEYDGGRFVLPKLTYSMVYDSSSSYRVPSEAAHDEIVAKALQIPIEFSADYFSALCVPENSIGEDVDGRMYYTINTPYRLKNGWDLFLNCARGTPDANFAVSYVLKNIATNEIIPGGVGFSTATANQKNNIFVPTIFMFEDARGWAYVTYMTNEKFYGTDFGDGRYTYGLCSPGITLDSSDTQKERYEILFTVTDTDDPYGLGGSSGSGGGAGTFSDTGDNIEIPNLPTLSAVDTGFITLFNPTIGQLYELANYMWSDLFDVETWKKIFADPMDAILGMSIVPVNVPAGATTPVTVGNISTGVSMTRAASQFVSVDCGTLNVKEFWGAYLDYDPYTKAEIYLPYIGTHALAVDDIMNKSVHVVYHVDILSGACCAYVKCGGSVLYTFVGQCSCSIPITGNDWTNVINGALSIATAIGSMVATGGASAPLAVASVASTAVNSMKPNVEKSGSLGGMGGMMGIQTPYLILTRPRQALPKDQNTFLGYPSFMTNKLSGLSGYTEIESIHLENVPATEQELYEIETLLKGGVIL